jgi:hypothetical protein
MSQHDRRDEHEPARRSDGAGDSGTARRGTLDGTPAGSHPLGTGAGAGMRRCGGRGHWRGVGGPAGAAVGATFGAVGGGLAGHAAADAINPAEEDSYWRDNYLQRPYADGTLSYDHYRPAYRYGWESRERHAGRRWTEVERELERGWRGNRGTSRLGWSEAKHAARDAWQRIDNRVLDERERTEAEQADQARAEEPGSR